MKTQHTNNCNIVAALVRKRSWLTLSSFLFFFAVKPVHANLQDQPVNETTTMVQYNTNIVELEEAFHEGWTGKQTDRRHMAQRSGGGGDAGISNIIAPSDSSTACDAITPIVELTNFDNTPLTSVTINYDIDGGPNQTFLWIGNLTTGATANITLPTMSLPSGAHTLNASTANPNGNADSNTSNDANASSFTASSGGEITVTINTDCWGYETYWEIVTQGVGVVVASGGNSIVYPGGLWIAESTDPGAYGDEVTITETFCLSTMACYDFVIYDDYGDGMYGSQDFTCNTDGSYTIEDEQGNVLASTIAPNANFGNSETNLFCMTFGCPTITTNASAVSASCNGICNGSVTASGAGGQSPYTYSWDNGLGSGATHNNLCAGTYTVVVTDANGCTGQASITVSEPAILSVNASATDATCNGVCDGSVTASGSGGTPPYMYSWTGGLGNGPTHNNVCAGTYTVTITDANGCTIPTSVTVNEPTILSANASATDASCNGVCDGSVTASGSGGTPPYTYSWAGLGSGATHNNVCAGTYTVTITDANGCTTPVSVTVNEPIILSANASAIDATCNGVCDGSVAASGSGGTPPYMYSWTGGLGNGPTHNNLCAGTYTVTITDVNGCATVASVTVNEAVVLSITGSTTDEMQGGDGAVDITVTGGTSPYSFAWTPGGQTTEDISGLTAGSYTVTVTDANQCVSQPETFIVGTQVGVTGLGLEQGISIYPNPTEGEFMLEMLTASSSELQIKVTDVRGRLVYNSTVNVSGAYRQQIDLTHEEKGMYFIHVVNGEEQVVRKVMKQ